MNINKNIGGAANNGVGNNSVMSEYAKRLREMKSAADSLSKSTDELPVAGRQQQLGSMIKRVEMMNAAQYSGKSWNKLMKAYALAKKISMQDSPSVKELNRAIRELMAALAAMENAEKDDDSDEKRENLPLIIDLKSDQATANDTVSDMSISGASEAAEGSAGITG